ncbi:MAG: hypothetical protein ACR2N3_10830 [Pyrinomonadaceae bacterium]
MKIIISLLFIVIFAFVALGQSKRYVNSEYNFSFLPPSSEIDNEVNKETGYLITYTCPQTGCGLFSLTGIKPFPKSTTQEVVELFQENWVQENAAQELVSGFDKKLNVVVLSKKYAAYNGRPAIKVDYNFVSNNVSFTGEMVGIFIAEKQVILGFNFVALTTQSKKWNELCENAIRSITVDTPNGLTSFNWKLDAIKKYEAKNWKYIGYSGEGEKMSLYFIDSSIFVRKGVFVNVAINIVPKNPQNYLSERTRNATPSQIAALPKKSLLYVHQLFGIKCDTKQYQIFQEQVFWEDGSGNDVDFGKMSAIIAQKGSIGEVIVTNACKQ